MYLEARSPLVLNFNPFIAYRFDDRPEYNDQVSYVMLLHSAETVRSVTPVPDRHDRAPVSFCRNRYTDENNVIHKKKLKTNTRHLFLASYGAECYHH